MLTLIISKRRPQAMLDLHRDGRVGTAEGVAPEDLAVVVEAIN
jgi:hypothetical protein